MKIEEEIDVQQERIAELESQLAQAKAEIERMKTEKGQLIADLMRSNFVSAKWR